MKLKVNILDKSTRSIKNLNFRILAVALCTQGTLLIHVIDERSPDGATHDFVR